MIQVKFIKTNGEIVTYFISNVWVYFFFYSSTIAILLLVKRRRNRKLKQTSNLVRGGAERNAKKLSECISKPDGAYEIVDPNLKQAIRKILDIKNTNTVLIIDKIVLLAASVFATKIGTKLAFQGIEIIIENLLGTIIAGGVGLAAGGITFFLPLFLPLKMLKMGSTALLGLALLVGGGVGVGIAEYRLPACTEYVKYLPELNRGVQYIDLPSNDNIQGKIYLKQNEEKPIYITKTEIKKCEIETLGGEKVGRKTNHQIQRRCQTEQNFVPLKERTKTLKDLKLADDTSTLQQIESAISHKDKEKIKTRLQN